MLLLGVVWTSRGRSTSTGFLRVVVGLVLLIVLLESGGRLWWRFVGTSAWENVPDAEGCVRQSSGWTCSPASAAMLLHHYGIASSEGELAYLAGTNYLGTDAPSIAYALNKKAEPKFRAHVAEISYDACIRFEMPFLAAVHVPGLGGHMVLVLRVHEDHVALIDPRFGLKQKPRREEFEGQFEKKIVYLTDGN
jgi:ABC-type bacteriocin/lantibiotic exporter with double-glycine peptidase domain